MNSVLPLSKPDQLRALLARDICHIMPCCWDALSAKMIEQAGFEFTFMSGFAVSAARLALPDTGFMSFGETVSQGRDICTATRLPVLGDGDTGYGNPMNVKRTVQGFADAGFAAVMIEDQVSPKRCGHTSGKEVVSRTQAVMRIRAALDAREEGSDILILARTDARATHGLDEALWRAAAFAEMGVDILFVEAPQSVAELQTIPDKVPGIHMANQIEDGITPLVKPDRLKEFGYSIAAYPLTLLSASMLAMKTTLKKMISGQDCSAELMSFEDIKRQVGFEEYYAAEEKYKISKDQ